MKIEFESAPSAGCVIPVCEGIEWACLPLPFALDHVNCWLLGGQEQPLLIDTGVDNPQTRAHWATIFGQRRRWPLHMLITHFHPDHMGLAGWFETKGCPQFSGSEKEIKMASGIWSRGDDQYADNNAHWYRTHGLPEETVAQVLASGNTYRKLVHQIPVTKSWEFLQDGQSLTLAGQRYTVIVGRGHAPDMIMLFRSEDNVLIAADQVLPFISPNVSVMPRLVDQNPLASFLSTLDRLRALPDDTLVLPSHGLPFRGLHGRLQALKEHHDSRLELVLAACHQPQTACDLFSVLFRRKLDAQQTSFALGESLAHIHFLEHQNKLRRIEDTGLTQFLAV